MNQILREIVDAENQARSLVDAATAEASALLAATRQAAQQHTAENDDDAREAAGRLIAAACLVAGTRQHDQLAAATLELEREIQLPAAAQEQLLTAALCQLRGADG